jgi:hypothetical protein
MIQKTDAAGLVPPGQIINQFPLADLIPAAVNDKVYKPVDPDDADIIALSDSILRNGLIHPIVVTTDNVILSGHRRYVACQLAGLDVAPVQRHAISSTDPAFVGLLVSCNTQREKTRDERLRESVIQSDPEEAYQALLEHRDSESAVTCDTIELKERKNRKTISWQKREMADAVLRVMEANRKFGPMSVRAIHYRLLNETFFRNTKTETRYVNDLKCYSDTSELTTRMRLNQEIPLDAISDDTRPGITWAVHKSPGSFIRAELANFLKAYRRKLQQSQPNHIEVIVEKNTVLPILKPIASWFNIPITSSRGFASIPPRHAIAERYNKSGADKLILIVCSDFDPEGEAIPETVARSLRDDFDIGLGNIECVKAALTHTQVETMTLPSEVEAKPTSSRFREFSEKYGTQTYELEALDPETLQELLSDAIDSVIDHDAFNTELDAEKQDAAFLQSVRYEVQDALSGLQLD